MNPTLETALGILASQAQEAINRAPSKYGKDITNVQLFIMAVGQRATTATVADCEQMTKDLDPIFKGFVNGLISIGKPSFAWLFGGFDPFKDMRFAADAYGRKWNLDWKR